MGAEKTELKEVRHRFLTHISDPMYADLEEDVAIADINNLILSAVPLFHFPRQPIEIDAGGETFNRELDSEEIEILARLCVVKWLDRHIADTNVIEQTLGDKDFERSGQARHLDALNDARDRVESRTRDLMRTYGRKDSSGNPDYSGLVGGAIDARRRRN